MASGVVVKDKAFGVVVEEEDKAFGVVVVVVEHKAFGVVVEDKAFGVVMRQLGA